MRKVAVLLADGFEEIEALTVVEIQYLLQMNTKSEVHMELMCRQKICLMK